MPTFLLIIQLVSQLLPLLVSTVKQIEAAFPDTPGSSKLSILEATIKSAFDGIGTAAISFDKVWPVLSSVASATVAVFNQTGVFKGGAANTVNQIGADVQKVGDALASVHTQAAQ